MIKSPSQNVTISKTHRNHIRMGVTFWPVVIFIGYFVGLPVLLLLDQRLATTPGDFWWSSTVVWVTLLTATILAGVHPHLFSLRTFRLPGVFLISYAVILLMPLPFIYTSHHLFPSQARDTFLYGTTLAFLCTLCGVLLFQYLKPVSRRRLDDWVLSLPLLMPNSFRSNVVFLLVFCFAILLLYVRQVGTLPIMQAIAGGFSTVEIAQAREESLKLIAGRIRYVYSGVRDMVFPYTTILLLAFAMASRELWHRILFCLSFLGTAFFSVSTAAKSPIASVIMMLLVARLLLKGEKLSTVKGLFFLIAIVAAPLLIVAVIYGFAADFGRIVNAIAQRIFHVPCDVLFYYFAYFPEHENFLLGRTMPVVNKFYDEGYFDITNTIYLFGNPHSLIQTGSANGAYVGFLWADFGWVGVIVGSVVLGMLLQGLQLMILRQPKSGPSIAIQALYVYNVVMLTSTSIFQTVLALDLTVLLLFTVAIIRTGIIGRISGGKKEVVPIDNGKIGARFEV